LLSVNNNRVLFNMPQPASEILRADDSDLVYYQVLGPRGEYLSGERDIPLPGEEDKPGVLADITRILADQGISIDAMLQREPEEGEGETDIIILTHVCQESAADTAIAKIEGLAAQKGKVKRIRLEELQ